MTVYRWLRRGAATLAALALAASAAGVAAHDTDPARAAIVLAPGYTKLDYPAPTPGSYALPPIGAAADAPYVDSHAARGQLAQLYPGHVTLLSFIYTSCEDVNGCPLASYVMAQVAKQLAARPAIASRLRLVSYSFDPARDTPAVLEQYAQPFRRPGVPWDFVTAPDTDSLARALGAYDQAITRGDGHTYAHILRVFLVDGDARIRNIYSPAFLHADTVAADIETLLLERGDASTNVATAAAPDALPAATLGLPAPPAGVVPAKAAEIALGERLFFDRRLSLNNTLSCAMCHVPAQGFTVNELATAVGIEGRTVRRNAPTLLNVGLLHTFFHDGRENRLEQQVWGPLLAANEMGNPSIGRVIDRIDALPEYREGFRTAYGQPPGMENVGRALAAYERTLVAGGSAFDRWRYGGAAQALSGSAQRGFALFTGKARCGACHTVGAHDALFTDQGLHDTGLGFAASMSSFGGKRTAEIAPGTALRYDLAAVAASSAPPPNDLGRYEITQDPADRWKFRTPSLRNVALTRPYMHNGSLSTLADVVAYYNDGGVPHDELDPLIKPLGLSASERADLVAFLESLTSPAVAGLVEHARAIAIGNPGAVSP